MQIQSLLIEFDKMKTENRIRQWTAKAQFEAGLESRHYDTLDWRSSDAATGRTRPSSNMAAIDMAVTTYFPRARGLNGPSPPDIVKYCGLYPQEIIGLFDLYYQRINPFFSILDHDLHTPDRLIWTSPFLFTVICAIASRYYAQRPELYSLAMNLARDAAGKALIDSSKSVDVCQAFLLLAVYPTPKKKWAQDRSWLLMGVAIRMALELQLNEAPPPGCDEREALNRTRTWLNCFCVDGSHAIQFGKLPMLRLDDYLARHSQDWYRSSSMNIAYDIHLCGYVDLIILMAKWKKAINEGSAKRKSGERFDLVDVCVKFDDQLSSGISKWVQRYAGESNRQFVSTSAIFSASNELSESSICVYRGNTTQMIAAYLRLVVLSLAFQHALKTGLTRDSYVVKKSMDAARKVIQIMVERLYPTGTLKYAMEAHFLYVAFAAAFLLNFLRPKLLPLLDEIQHREIIAIVHQLISILGSNAVALDGRHTPALYSRFLSNLLAKHHAQQPIASSSSNGYPAEDIKFIPQFHSERQQTPPHMCSWPDTLYAQGDSPQGGQVHAELPAGTIYQESGEADMDFSLAYFMRSVDQGPPYGTPSPDQAPAGLGGLGPWDTHHGIPHPGDFSQICAAAMQGPSAADWSAYGQLWNGQH
ncbi:hypothetical protein HGRIS_013130 [Hohenbuehelia grisea]|uniref:Xylanolytic transcriptional activator regulatory domain-containing protein n=1 Tax=Hohenbuehelia grisea TaxID=104357 RepID=A0ABR3IUN3_9AGAR